MHALQLDYLPTDTPAQRLAKRVLRYMRARSYAIATAPGTLNIVYLEGADRNGHPNRDRADDWNDLRLLISCPLQGAPSIVHCAVATTEPGASATMTPAARARGGVARIAFGQYEAWRVGFHKSNPRHPALVQVRPLTVHRDANRDGKRPGDRQDTGLFGINQHGTSAAYRSGPVGTWSEGCLVGRVWSEHIEFMRLCMQDARYVADPLYVFTATIIAADDMAKLEPV